MLRTVNFTPSMSTVFVSFAPKSTEPVRASFGAGSDWGDGVAEALLVFEGLFIRAAPVDVGDE